MKSGLDKRWLANFKLREIKLFNKIFVLEKDWRTIRTICCSRFFALNAWYLANCLWICSNLRISYPCKGPQTDDASSNKRLTRLQYNKQIVEIFVKSYEMRGLNDNRSGVNYLLMSLVQGTLVKTVLFVT